jgi:hypothetical protein
MTRSCQAEILTVGPIPSQGNERSLLNIHNDLGGVLDLHPIDEWRAPDRVDVGRASAGRFR